LDVIAGYTSANDVSARDAQFGDGQWFRGKNYDTFCPIGPRIVPVAELDALDVGVIQRLDGEVFQRSPTSHLIFTIPVLVSYISQAFTLEPGDVILTGTLEGVGVSRNPKVGLKEGDVVEWRSRASACVRTW
jgi:2-keto-4-pentenoate hydratase/2-oxohepta-3-ene-1,7-dioic acid hydratase in catechol pathway